MSRRRALAVAAVIWTVIAPVAWYPYLSNRGAHRHHPMQNDREQLISVYDGADRQKRYEAKSCQQLSAVAAHSGAIFRTGGLSREGIGSFIQQLKLSAVAAVYLNKTLIIDQSIASEHGYNVPELINEAANYTSDGSDRCSITLSEEVAHAMCAHMAGQQHNTSILQEFKAKSSCNELTQHKDKYIPYELYNDCIQPWLQDTFRSIFRQRQFTFVLKSKKCLNVGIHIRFGDRHTDDLQRLDKRSMQLTDVIFVVQNLKKLPGVCYNFYLFAKHASTELKKAFPFPHEFVDSPNDLYDIYVYTLMDIFIQGSSSFSVISSLIEPNKTIITNALGNKYTFTYKQVSRVYHFQYDLVAYLKDVGQLRPNVFRHQCHAVPGLTTHTQWGWVTKLHVRYSG